MDDQRPTHNENDLDMPIWGAAEIAKAINRSERQTFHLLEAGELPARKIGGRWTTTRRQLREVFERAAVTVEVGAGATTDVDGHKPTGRQR
jgi:hypothetical protein